MKHGTSFGEMPWKEMNKEILKSRRKDKNAYIRKICEEIRRHANTNEPHDLYEKVKLLSPETSG